MNCVKVMKEYKSLLHNKSLSKIILGDTFSRFGDGIDTIVFSLLAYRITGSTALMATVFAVNGLPNIIFSIWSGALSTKKSEKTVIWMCDVIRAILAFLIGVLFITNQLNVMHLYIITFLNSTVETFRAPASTSLLGKVVNNEDELTYAISIKSTLEKISEVAGLAFAPFICTFLGLYSALFIDALTFLICAAFMITIKGMYGTNNDDSSYFLLIKEGYSYARSNKVLVSILVFTVIVNVVFVPLNAFQVPLVENELLMGDYTLSIISIMLTVGMAIGATMYPLMEKCADRYIIFKVSGVGISIAYFIIRIIVKFSIEYKIIGIIIAMLLLGGAISNINIALQSLFYEAVSETYYARMGAISSMAAYCANPIFSAIFGFTSNYMSILNIFLVCGLFELLIFIFVPNFFSKKFVGYQ